MTCENIFDINKENYSKIGLNSSLPVLLDFWAIWCTPCKPLEPVLEYLARLYKGRLIVGRVNADEEIQLVKEFDIRNLPTLILIKDGKVSETIIGARSRFDLRILIEKYL
ncbi:MAG: thioredoxin [Clostridiaceae bacterium]|nr:thioredoxin [Clostridiaceae bacterium]